MRKFVLIFAAPLLALLFLGACTENVGDPVEELDDDPGAVLTQNTCLGCHASEDRLKSAAGSSGAGLTVVAVKSGDG